MRRSLVADLKTKLADTRTRCKPQCYFKDWTDLPGEIRKGYIRTVCGVCGTWIGDRPIDAKSQTKNISTESKGT